MILPLQIATLEQSEQVVSDQLNWHLDKLEYIRKNYPADEGIIQAHMEDEAQRYQAQQKRLRRMDFQNKLN